MRCNAPVPEVSPNPIADETFIKVTVGPGANIADNLIAKKYGAAERGGITDDIVRPVAQECIPITRRKSCEPGGFRIKLMLEEVGGIASLNRTECYL